ncbi:MAG: hypothetical protein JWP91_3722 [Fibrobacteres bacterium]|nr:hypothetical protein [Fibrobacterota bacterium]
MDRRFRRFPSLRFSPFLMLRWAFLLIALAATSVRAQLDLGSQDVPQSEIDDYMDPFYHVIATGLGGGRFTPRDQGTGWDLGFQAGMVPLPDRQPFQSTNLSALPLFRLRSGARFGGADLMARGLIWKDPRVGRLATYGGGAAYGRDVFKGKVPVAAAVMGGWDRLDFTSTYTYRYRGSALGLFDQDVPGDYTLTEQVSGGGLMLSARLGDWTPYAQGWFEWTSGRFAYLYLDPRDDKNHEVKSDLGFPGARGSLGILWHGAHIEASLRSHLSLEAGWSWIH